MKIVNAILVFFLLAIVFGATFVPRSGEAQVSKDKDQIIQDLEDQVAELKEQGAKKDQIIQGLLLQVIELRLQVGELEANQAPDVLQCYLTIGGDLPMKVFFLKTQSSKVNDRAELYHASIVCESAQLLDEREQKIMGTPTGMVWQCFTLKLGNTPRLKVKVDTGIFKPDDLTLGTSNLGCLKSKMRIPDDD
jgi:hypothetical protein